jgi:thiamine-phosphate pyrophosphorylase
VPHAPRIIDANLNRAREALRTLEDIARFALDSHDLCARLKQLRHDVRAAIESAIDRGVLLAWRDTPGDVGTAISTPAETARSGLPAIAAAASSRLTEALRSIEECLKLNCPSSAAAIESLRYRAYDLERRLSLSLGTGRAPQWRLCILVSESLCAHHPWDSVAAQAIEGIAGGGADCLQLREKSLPDAELLARARRLVELARQTTHRRIWVIINDRPDIALAAGADGVHLGQTDVPVEAVRKLAGFTLLVGASTANLDQARAALAAGADYCAVGPMFPTTTADKPVTAGPVYLRQYLADPALAQRPHLAIGGITPDNLPQLVALGCRGIAVSGFVCKAQRPAVACRALYDGFAPTH